MSHEQPKTQTRTPLGTFQSDGNGPAVANWSHVLAIGTRLGEFEITNVIGEGGFGIVYLAFDHQLERRVALKEYMPSSMATRSKDSATISVKYDHQQEFFHAGLRSFVNEARLLAQFDHVALVKVHRFWEANNTAYMVMPFYEGPTLRSALKQMALPPDETWLLELLMPLLDALNLLHDAQCFHRDIAPDNILLTPAGPLLLDFGAARRVLGAANQALTVILKPGYAPIEQYGEVASMAQGPWTDIYALCCVVYSAITGKKPVASVERLLDDKMEPLAQLAAGRYSERFLKAIDAGLAIKPNDRPQNVAQFRVLLGLVTSINITDDNDPPRTLVRAANKAKARTQRRPLVAAVDESHGVQPNSIDSSNANRNVSTVIAIASVVLIAAIGFAGYRHFNATSTATPAATPAKVSIAPAGTAPFASAPSSSELAKAPHSADKVSLSVSSSLPALQSSAASTSPLPAPTAVLPDKPQPDTSKTVAVPKMAITDKSYATKPAPLAANTANATPEPKSDRSAQRCRELLQEASLEALSAEDSRYLRQECK
jgi:serine/threonine protein kinase